MVFKNCCLQESSKKFIIFQKGQASLEYLLIALVLIVAISGLFALYTFVADGKLERIFDVYQSHNSESFEGLVDVFLY